MKQTNKIPAYLWRYVQYLMILLLCLLMIYSCSSNVAGGSEIGNPVIVIGIISDGTDPAEQTQVLLIPSEYNPVEDDSVPDYAIDTTDKNGVFRFTGVDSGMYTLFATDLQLSLIHI